MLWKYDNDYTEQKDAAQDGSGTETNAEVSGQAQAGYTEFKRGWSI